MLLHSTATWETTSHLVSSMVPPTSEKERPGLQKQPTVTGHGMPVNHIVRTAKRVHVLVLCQECTFPGVLHSQRKLTERDKIDYEALNHVDYTCGSTMKDFAPSSSKIL